MNAYSTAFSLISPSAPAQARPHSGRRGRLSLETTPPNTNTSTKAKGLLMSHLQPVEDLLGSDAVKYHQPAGTSELYSAVGDAESILHLMAHQLRQLVWGLGELPTESGGLRTDTMDGVLDPGETVGVAMAELNQAAQKITAAADHVRAALNKTARLYIA